MSPDSFLFWFLTLITLVSATTMVFVANPIYSALALAMTMIGVSALFVTLNAYFIAGVQLIVYAGAVMVLFVMVLMLFDLKHELLALVRGKISGALKILSLGLFAGIVVGAMLIESPKFSSLPVANPETITGDTTKELGRLLFTKYLFGFEALGFLLLVVAVGVVTVSRSKGGTHADH